MQLMPETAAGLGVQDHLRRHRTSAAALDTCEKCSIATETSHGL